MPFKRLASLFSFLALLTPLAALESIFPALDPETKVDVKVVPLFTLGSKGGFLPIRVTIANRSKLPGSLDVNCSSSSDYQEQNETSSNFRITVGPEETVSRDVLAPIYNPGTGISSTALNITMSGTYGSARKAIPVYQSDDNACVLLSEPLFIKNAGLLTTEAQKGSSHSYGSDEFASMFDATQLPEDWRAFSGYDAIILTDAEWTSATPGSRNAILQWNRMGGSLIIYSTTQTNAKSLGITLDDKDSSNASNGFRSKGQVDILPIDASLSMNAEQTVQLVNPSPSARNLFPGYLHTSINSDFERNWPLQNAFGEKSFRYGVFVIVLILFAILVGPVNLFVFAKSGRRHRLFITTPLIALGASLILILLIFLEDGFGGRGFRLVMMEVRPDNGENAIYLQQEQISRTGVLLGSGFEIDTPAFISQVRLDTSRWARFTNSSASKARFEIKTGDSNKMQIGGDWFQSRSEQGQLLQAVVPSRGRIELHSSGGAPSLVSTFDFPVKTLWYQDESGGYWRADDVTAGKTFTCSQIERSTFEAAVNDEKLGMTSRSGRQFNRLFNRRGYFVAISEDEATGLSTFRNINWERTHTVITGPVVKP